MINNCIAKIEYNTGDKKGLWNSFEEIITLNYDSVIYKKIWYVNMPQYNEFKEELMYDYKDVEWKIEGGTNLSTIYKLKDYIIDLRKKKVSKDKDNDIVTITINGECEDAISFSISKYSEVKEELRTIVFNSLVDEVKVPDFIKNADDLKAESFNKQIKSRERVEKHGEVFTNEREVKAMCDLVKQETDRIDSRFLEPACGDGNFLVEILTRKLETVKKKYKKSPFDYEKQSLLAVSSIYGVDIMQDNVIETRKRLYELWEKQYNSICKEENNDETKESIRFILKRNIVCGNALTLKCVDENGEDKDEPIVFSEWAFVTGSNMQRCDYTFSELLSGEKDANDEGKFLKRYVTNYRRLRYYE